MPAIHGEKLYGPPGPQNNAVLMDIITKLKRDLQQSRTENGKLVDQLNVLISLVKRWVWANSADPDQTAAREAVLSGSTLFAIQSAIKCDLQQCKVEKGRQVDLLNVLIALLAKRAWSGEQSATLHLANIVGVSAPSFTGSEPLRNTPVPDKTRAVKNWERLAIRLLEKEYAAIQAEIKERQKLYMERRQMYMDYVIDDHNDEMAKFNLHKQKSATSVQDVDKKFLRCYSAKPGGSRKKSSGSRPKSAYNSQPRTASDMAERAEVSVADLIGQNGAQNQEPMQNDNTNAVFTGLYRMSSLDNERRPPRRRQQQFDDPNRYKQRNLFDPDVIFSPELLSDKQTLRSRPSSASQGASALKTRPKSAVFITEGKSERPLRYETTRPISGKPRPNTSTRERRNSAPSRRTSAPAMFAKKELHSKDEPFDLRIETNFEDQSGHVTADSQDEEILTNEKPPMSVKVKRGHPMDKFMNDLRMTDEMGQMFQKSAIDLQKRLGIETDGIVY